MKPLTDFAPREYALNEETVASLFGHEAAEREDVQRLKQYFLRRSDYEAVVSNLPLKIVIGFKGVGKSAVLKVAYLEDLENQVPAIWIRPDDISEIYSDITSEQNQLRLITLWKKGLARLIASRLVEDVGFAGSEDATKAITWAEEVGYRSKDLISQLASRFAPLTSKYISQDIPSVGSKTGEHHVLQRLLEKKKVKLYIDDLDRGWEATERDRKRLAALINSLGDMTSDIRGLQVRISVRADVYALVRGTAEFTDKFETSEVWCSWSNHEILVALVKRIYSHFGIEVSEDELREFRQSQMARFLSPLFAQRFEGTRCWSNAPMYRVIMSLIRRRPRDLVKLCSLSEKRAYNDGYKTICGPHIFSILEDYSSGRMQDIIIEFKSELPNITDLVYNLGPTVKELKEKKHDRYLYNTNDLYEKIKNVMSNVRVEFAGNANPDFHDVAHFLFKIGFITATKILPDGFIDRLYYEDKRQLLQRSVGDMGYSWEIHPAYRGALFKRTQRDDNWENSIQPDGEKD